MATFQLTVISAVLSSNVELDPEPRDVYAMVKFGGEQRRTKTAHDHGKSPVWNEILTFTFEDQALPKFIFVQLFHVRSDADELLGVARISVPTSGDMEGSLHVLVSPSKGKIGALKAIGRWESNQQGENPSSLTGPSVAKTMRDDAYGSYPLSASTYDDVTSTFSNLAVSEGQRKLQHPSFAHPSNAFHLPRKAEEVSTHTSPLYSSPHEVTSDQTSPLPYPPNPSAYPPYPDHLKSSSSSDLSHISEDRHEEEQSYTTMRGFGETEDRGHHSHLPYGYLPRPMFSGGHAHADTYLQQPYGYPPQHVYPSPGWGPPPAYPPAHVHPSPYGYPPTAHPYPPYPYPSHGYPPHMSYPSHPGYGSYAPGTYVGHSSSGKHKHHKHHKMKIPKHSMVHYGYGYPQPHPSSSHHYKHKK